MVQDSLLPNLRKPSVIVLDNAPYHSKILDKTPTMSSRKVEMVGWLRKHNIVFESHMHKAELMELISLHKPPFPVYVIDEMAKESGHRVIRLPPYHCHFNSIELIWAQIKGYVARNNKKFNITEVTSLTNEALEKVTKSEWRKVVNHTKQVISDAFVNEGILEEAVEDMIIYINNDSDDSSDDDWENDGILQLNENNELYDDDLVMDSDVEEDIDLHEDGEMDDDNESDLSGVLPLSPRGEKVLDFSDL